MIAELCTPHTRLADEDGSEDDGSRVQEEVSVRGGGSPRATPASRPEASSESTTASPAEADKESFGTWLRRQRELREITLREIADTSKISLRYLQALEEDRFDLLPAEVFAKGFLRQYARYVGLDPEETVNFFLDARGQEEEDQDETPPRPAAAVATWFYAVAAIAVAILLMMVVWWLIRLNQGESGAGGATAAAPEANRPEDSSPRAREPGAGREEVGSVALEPAATVAREAGAAAEPPVGRPPVPLAVTVDFRGDCWVQVAVDGESQESRVYVQGESLQLEAQNRVELKLGNVFVTDVEVNGHPMELEERSGTAVQQILIDLETAAVLAAENQEASASRSEDAAGDSPMEERE